MMFSLTFQRCMLSDALYKRFVIPSIPSNLSPTWNGAQGRSNVDISVPNFLYVRYMTVGGFLTGIRPFVENSTTR